MNADRAFIFIAGVAVGASAAWLCLRKYYANIAQEEIDSVKETYARTNRPTEKEPVRPDTNDELKQKEEILNIIKTHYAQIDNNNRNNDYTSYSSGVTLDKEEFDPDISSEPYVIPPDECGEEPEYSITELTYFALDDILVDSFGEIVEDPDILVGRNFKGHFGEYEDDSVFVRNEQLKCDFEILKDLDNYIGAY